MCMCIECVGDVPEPYDYKDDNGKVAIWYKNDRLTDEYDSVELAWAEFNYKSKHGVFTAGI